MAMDPARLYPDGIFDLFHFGHARPLEQAKLLISEEDDRRGQSDELQDRLERLREVWRSMLFLTANMISSLHEAWFQFSSSANSDLKPANILLDPNMEYKIADLGLSGLSDCGDGAHASIVSNLLSLLPRVKSILDKIGSHTKHAPKYLSVHPPIQMVLFAHKSSEGISSYIKYIMPSDPVSCKAEHGITKAMGTKTSDPWIVATGSPHHATGNRTLLSGSISEHDGLFVHAVDRAPMQVRGCGTLVTAAVVLPDVWVVPGLTANLVSVRQLNELGYIVGFGGGACYISSAADGTIIGKATLGEGGLYVLDFLKVPLGM